MAGSNGNKKDDADEIPHIRKETRPDFSKPLPPSKLPETIQKRIDKEETLWSSLYDGSGPDSTSSDVRYAAYASRVRTILVSAQRYVAYTSDIGESFRPVAHPYLIKGAYAISWLYLTGDVVNEGYKAYTRNQEILHPKLKEGEKPSSFQDKTKSALGSVSSAAGDLVHATPAQLSARHDYRTVMAERAIFQGLASMGLPAFTIHSIVRYSGRALKNAGNKNIRTWGPIGLGLVAVPFLPFVFDAPVEHAVEWTFDRGFELAGKGPKQALDEAKKEL